MRICHIITRLIQGGAQQNTVACCADQVAAGHEVWLAYGKTFGPEGSLEHEARRAGAQLVEVPDLVRAVRPLRDRRCIRELERIIESFTPDVVHTHSSKAGILGRAAAWNQDVPAVVHTIHGLGFHDRQRWLARRAFVAAERWAARRCHHMVGITQAMVDTFRANGIGRAEQFSVIPSGVDVAPFDAVYHEREAHRRAVRERLEIPAEAPVVGIVARLDPLKGHDDLLDVMPRLLERHPELRLLIVGEGWYGNDLRRRVGFSSLGEQVVFTGLVKPQDVAAHYAAMDLMALPSYQEGQGRTLVESQLCGTPTVGYAVGGIPEVLDGGRCGQLVNAGDREGLLNSINALLTDEAQRGRLAAAGRAHAAERYSAARMVADVRALYERLLENRRQ